MHPDNPHGAESGTSNLVRLSRVAVARVEQLLDGHLHRPMPQQLSPERRVGQAREELAELRKLLRHGPSVQRAALTRAYWSSADDLELEAR